MNEKILLVEDDIDIVKHLISFLENEGFFVYHTDGQTKAMDMIENQYFDLILLDLSLKEGHGFSLYHQIKSYQDIPIIFLTASNDEYSVVTGLNLGLMIIFQNHFGQENYYHVFSNVLKRYQRQNIVFKYQDIKLNTLTGQVLKNNQEIILSALEYKLLLIFISHPHQLLLETFY